MSATPNISASDAEFFGASVSPEPYADVPKELKTFPNFLCWKSVVRNGKATKIPFDPKTGFPAKTNDPTTWATFEQAVGAADPLSGNNYDGIGFVFTDPLQGADLDGVVQTSHDVAVIDLFAAAIAKLANTYCEYSPSATGIHIIWQSSIPLPSGNRKGSKKLGGELYDKNSPRYFTATGNKVPELSANSIAKIENPDTVKLLHFLVLHIDDAKLTKLWLGKWQEVKDSNGAPFPTQSEADLSLCNALVRGGFNSFEKLDAAFRQSGLMRPEWDRTSKYTIEKALGGAASGNSSPAGIQSASKELEFHLPAVTTGTNYDFVIEPAPGQTDGWFPLGSPSLIGGSSGSNKSTWMMHLLLAQLRQEPFLGHPTYARTYLVLMADRGEASHQRTMRRMRMENENIPIKFLSLKTGSAALQEIIGKIEETNPLPQIVFIEGCDMLVEDANKKQIVGPFMGALQKIATYYHLAIVGSVGAPKCKAGEGYIAKRDNISGTEAWSRLAETVVLLQYPKGKDTVSERELTVLPRNAPAESFVMVMKRGRLELQTEEDRRNAGGRDQEIQWVRAQARAAKTDPTKKWWTVLDMEQALDIPRTTAYRWAQHACAKDHITEKPGKKGRSKAALYRWNDSKTNPLWIEHEENDQSEMDI